MTGIKKLIFLVNIFCLRKHSIFHYWLYSSVGFFWNRIIRLPDGMIIKLRDSDFKPSSVKTCPNDFLLKICSLKEKPRHVRWYLKNQNSYQITWLLGFSVYSFKIDIQNSRFCVTGLSNMVIWYSEECSDTIPNLNFKHNSEYANWFKDSHSYEMVKLLWWKTETRLLKKPNQAKM